MFIHHVEIMWNAIEIPTKNLLLMLKPCEIPIDCGELCHATDLLDGWGVQLKDKGNVFSLSGHDSAAMRNAWSCLMNWVFFVYLWWLSIYQWVYQFVHIMFDDYLWVGALFQWHYQLVETRFEALLLREPHS